MSEKEPIPQDDSSEADDLDSLSAEEKAAFEKIMAEISLATGESPGDAPAPETEPVEATSAPSEPDTLPEDIPEPPKDPQSADPPPSENLDDDGGQLSEDQQDALNKIMAEIEGKRKSENSEESIESPEPTPEVATQTSGNEGEAESLSEDQQDALNSIMAEIEAKRNTDREESTPPPETDDYGDETLADDQQEALDKIMADIQAKRNRPSEPEASAEGDDPQLTKDQDQDLTIEEFDDELNSLLSAANDESSPTSDSPADMEKIDGPEENAPEIIDTAIDVATEEPPEQTETAPAPDTDTPEEPTWKLGQVPELVEITQDNGDGPPIKGGISHVLHTIGNLSWMAVKGVVIVAVIALTVLGGYSGYMKIRHWGGTNPPTANPKALSNPQTENVSGSPSAAQYQSDRETTPGVPTGPGGRTIDTPPSPGTSAEPWIGALTAARQHIQNKMSELQSLKAYYRKGIETDIQAIEPLTIDAMPGFKTAMANPAIELTIRSVQRRSSYMTKLDVPLKKLTALSEELLFLERRARLHDILSQGISGLSRTPLENQIRAALTAFEENSGQLAIDDIQVETPPLQAVWQDIATQISSKAKRLSLQSELNKTIGTEICSGNYHRLSQLTALSIETARCLAQWEGKDLYLNDVAELSPEAAQTLSQWTGEWLSLNGLQTLSSDTAHYLSQWPGKRLSLNGLSTLSPQATQQLSQWKGEQLEMVGLKSIGPWENYGTRLFLSEALQRRLDNQ